MMISMLGVGPSKNSYYSSITLEFCAWGSNCVTTLWSRGRLSDDAIGRSRYEWFYSVRSCNYARENAREVFEDVCESPVEGVFEGTFAFEFEATKLIKHISIGSTKSSKVHDYTWEYPVTWIYCSINTIYIYISVCKNFEPLIYISISIYRVHCGKGSTRTFTSSQSNVDKHVISWIYWAWIYSCGYMLMIFYIFFAPRDVFKN